MSALGFIDIETSGLDPAQHEAWEVALILRDDEDIEVEYSWQLPVGLGNAEAMALTVGRFYERRWDDSELTPTEDFATEFAELTHGAMLVGAVPSFDAGFLSRLLRANGACPGWSHRLICVETLVTGATGVLPRGLSKMAERVGIDPGQYETHTALGDARMARDVFNAVMALTLIPKETSAA